MTEYAPQAIKDLFAKIDVLVPEAVLSGILGDQAHTFGYHRCRDVLPGGDYSTLLDLDRAGDGQAAAALDINFPPAQMKLVTNRLLVAARAKDPRLKGMREFCGTTDGSNTHGYDLARGREHVGEWDDSHLWHIHISFYRAFVNDAATLAPIAQVIGGASAPPSTKAMEEQDMARQVKTPNGKVYLATGDSLTEMTGAERDAAVKAGLIASPVSVTDAELNSLLALARRARPEVQ